MSGSCPSAHTDHTSYQAVHLTEDATRAIVWQVLVEYLSVYVPEDAHVLELGANYCYWINGVRAVRKVAVDIWAESGRYAASDVQSVQHDLSKGLPMFGDLRFDVVMASNLLEHFEPDVASRLIADVYTCLRPSGRFIVIQPNFRYAYRHYFDDYTHRSIFTDVSLPNLMRSHGFHIEQVQARFLPYSLRGSRLPIRPWLVRAYLHSPIKPFSGQMLVIGQKRE
jgi:SAM-dependent methyltransferase